jgi:hypothetical protein
MIMAIKAHSMSSLEVSGDDIIEYLKFYAYEFPKNVEFLAAGIITNSPDNVSTRNTPHVGTFPFWCIMPTCRSQKRQDTTNLHILAMHAKEKGILGDDPQLPS